MYSSANSGKYRKAKFKDSNKYILEDALAAVTKCEAEAVKALIETLKDKDKGVRSNAAYALLKIGESAKPAVPQLIETLKQDQNNDVRSNAAYALGNIGESAKSAVPQLIETLKQDKEPNARGNAASALGSIGRSLQKNKKQLSSSELKQLVLDYEKAQTILKSEKDNKIFDTEQKENIANYLEVLKDEKQSRWTEKITQQGSITLLTHALIWAGLILIYPKSRQIQAMFFLEPQNAEVLWARICGFSLNLDSLSALQTVCSLQRISTVRCRLS